MTAITHRFAPRNTWTAICLADDPHKTLVAEDGAILRGFGQVTAAARCTNDQMVSGHLFAEVVSLRVKGAVEPVCTQRLLDPRAGVVVTVQDYGCCRLELICFGHRDTAGARRDVVRWTLVANQRLEPVLIQALRQPAGKALAWMTEDGVTRALVDGVEVLAFASPGSHPGSLPWWRDLAHLDSRGTHHAPRPALAWWKTIDHRNLQEQIIGCAGLEAGGVLEGTLVLPCAGADLRPCTQAWSAAALAETVAMWKACAPPALRTGCDDIDALTAICQRNLLQAREAVDEVPQFQVGCARYRGLWVLDGRFITEAAVYLGLEEGIDLAPFLRHIKPDGEVAVHDCRLDKQTGVFLGIVARACELTGNPELLVQHRALLDRSLDWIAARRAEAKALPEDHPAHGLWRAGFGDGGMNYWRHELSNPLGILFGLDSLARVARWTGTSDLAQRCTTLADDLRADLRRCAATTTENLDGQRWWPMWLRAASNDHIYTAEVADPAPWERMQPGAATYMLLQAISPGECFDPAEPLVQDQLRLQDSLCGEEGVPTGTGWMGAGSVWNYHTPFLAQAWLHAGRPDRAVALLYAFADHSSTTGVWREEQNLRSVPFERTVGDMPHNWASAEWIRLVRHLLAYERGEVLELLPGNAVGWPGGSSQVELGLVPPGLDGSPTRFGRLTLRFARTSEGLLVQWSLTGPALVRPQAIRVRRPDAQGGGWIDLGHARQGEVVVR